MTTPAGTGVGAAIGSGQISNILTAMSVAYRNLNQQAANLFLEINGQGNGLAVLVSLGFSNVTATSNPLNPGGITDAAWALQLISYFNTQAGVWFGTATQPSEFNFNNATSPLWAGQIGQAGTVLWPAQRSPRSS
jgi:hypothetical protein